MSTDCFKQQGEFLLARIARVLEVEIARGRIFKMEESIENRQTHAGESCVIVIEPLR
jgi:hypothetical protein